MLIMWTILGNGEELRHLNHQEDWLKTVVVFEDELLSTTNADGTVLYSTNRVPSYYYDIMSDKIRPKFSNIE